MRTRELDPHWPNEVKSIVDIHADRLTKVMLRVDELEKLSVRVAVLEEQHRILTNWIERAIGIDATRQLLGDVADSRFGCPRSKGCSSHQAGGARS